MPISYTTRLGDTWDAISYRVYGSELHIDVLLDANPQCNTIAMFGAGVVLTVPDLPAAEVAAANLPPWRLP